MRHFIFIIILVLTVCSCRSQGQLTQHTDTLVQKESKEMNDYDKTFRESIEKAVKETVEEIKQKFAETNWEYNKVNYSPPDSTGKQYPTTMESGKLNNKTQENSNHTEQKDEQFTQLTTYVERLVSRLDSFEARQDKMDSEYKDKLFWYQSALIFLGVIFVIYIIITIYIKLKKP